MDLKEVIFRIGYFRNKTNLSARALSLEIGKNPAYITKLEAGEYEPFMQVILDIIDACKTSPEEFFAESYQDYSLNKQTLNTISNLTSKKKIALNDLLS